MELPQIRLVFSFVLLAVFQVHGYHPPGKFDIGVADLNVLCPLVQKYGETEAIPQKPVPISVGRSAQKDCIYFKWVTCAGGEKTKANPCGHFQMEPCPKRRRRSPINEMIGQHEEIAEAGGEAPFLEFIEKSGQ